MSQHRTHPGGVVKDITRGLAAGQPSVRVGGVRAQRTRLGPPGARRAIRLRSRATQTLGCRHAMAHAGGVA